MVRHSNTESLGVFQSVMYHCGQRRSGLCRATNKRSRLTMMFRCPSVSSPIAWNAPVDKSRSSSGNWISGLKGVLMGRGTSDQPSLPHLRQEHSDVERKVVKETGHSRFTSILYLHRDRFFRVRVVPLEAELKQINTGRPACSWKEIEQCRINPHVDTLSTVF